MMKLLLANLGLVNPKGSEVWTWTIAEYLKTKGFDITILTNDIGQFASDYLNDFEVVTTVKGRKFDYGIINHARLLNDIENVNVKKAVFVSHGCMVDNERPIEAFNFPHEYVSVSEEVKAYWFKTIGIKSSVIVNPVRDEWFNMEFGKIRLYSAVFASHRHQIPESLVNAFRSNKIRLRRIKRDHPQSDVMAIIAASQLLIGTGRYIYEAMAAGRKVIVADSDKSLGYITKFNYRHHRLFNMTCRNPFVYTPDWNKLIKEYPNHNPADMREIARKEHHVSVIAEKLLEKLNV